MPNARGVCPGSGSGGERPPTRRSGRVRRSRSPDRHPWPRRITRSGATIWRRVDGDRSGSRPTPGRSMPGRKVAGVAEVRFGLGSAPGEASQPGIEPLQGSSGLPNPSPEVGRTMRVLRRLFGPLGGEGLLGKGLLGEFPSLARAGDPSGRNHQNQPRRGRAQRRGSSEEAGQFVSDNGIQSHPVAFVPSDAR
jgi:hypothetical protein